MIIIFHRKDGWYPIEIPNERSSKRDIEEHVRLNPGTLKVTDGKGATLWEKARQ